VPPRSYLALPIFPSGRFGARPLTVEGLALALLGLLQLLVSDRSADLSLLRRNEPVDIAFRFDVVWMEPEADESPDWIEIITFGF
jgi:hypothetical protein